MGKIAQENYDVYAKIIISASISIKATSLEDALKQSSCLKEEDFVEVKGEWINGSCIIRGVFTGNDFDD